MKIFATIVIAVHLSLFSIDGAFAQWLPQNSGTNNSLTSIFFVDNDNGWAVGSEGIILHTSDGGDNWFQQLSGTDNYLRSVRFIDSLNGWIAGGMYKHPELGIILRTCNGGLSWEEVYVDSLCWLTDIYFTDSLHGWAVGSYSVGWLIRGTILHSDDGGISWYRQEPFYLMPLKSIHFTDPDTGWVVGGFVAGSSGQPYCSILKTTSGGITWEEQINSVGVYSPLNSVCFTDTENGWAVGINRIWGFEPIPSILRTNNGGIQWDSTFYNTTNSLDYALTSVCFINNNTGWAVGGMWSTSYEWSLILHTQDGGDSWIEQDAGTKQRLNSVCFINEEEGWIAADSGTILHTNNSGVGLKELSLSNTNSITIYQYPNPFTTSTTLSYTLSKPSTVTINIFNPQGQLVEKIVQEQTKGEQKVQWNAEGLSIGMYYFWIQAGDKVGGGKMVLMK